VRCGGDTDHSLYGGEIQYDNDGEYVIESYGAPQIVNESEDESEDEAAVMEAPVVEEAEPQTSTESGYEAPIAEPAEQAKPLVDPTPIAPEPPAVPATKAVPPAEATPAPAPPAKSIAGIQDTETRIASLIQRLERTASTQSSF
jgi:hypothetical protein